MIDRYSRNVVGIDQGIIRRALEILKDQALKPPMPTLRPLGEHIREATADRHGPAGLDRIARQLSDFATPLDMDGAFGRLDMNRPL